MSYNEDIYLELEPQDLATSEFDTSFSDTQRGVIGDVGSLAARGLLSAGETFENAMEAWGLNDSQKDTVSSLRKYDFFKPDIDEYLDQGWLKETWAGSIPSAAESMGGSLAAAGTGAAAGALIGGSAGLGFGAIPGGIIGGILGSLGLMGSAEYQSTYEMEIKRGQTHDQAHDTALKVGAIEGLGESVGTAIGVIPGLSFIAKGAKKPALATLRALTKSSPKDVAKTLLKTYAGEQATEVGQSAGQTAVLKGAGHDLDYMENAAKTIIPTLFMTGAFGVASAGMQQAQVRDLKQRLNSSDPATRQEAANLVGAKLRGNKEYEDIAGKWTEFSDDKIKNKEDISFDENFGSFVAQKVTTDVAVITPKTIQGDPDATKAYVDQELGEEQGDTEDQKRYENQGGEKVAPAPTKSAYETLGVTKDTTYEEANKIRKELLKTIHPDRGGSTAQTQEINVAWQAIQKQLKRTGTKAIQKQLKRTGTKAKGKAETKAKKPERTISLPTRTAINKVLKSSKLKDREAIKAGRAEEVVDRAYDTLAGTGAEVGTLTGKQLARKEATARKVLAEAVKEENPVASAIINESLEGAIDIIMKSGDQALQGADLEAAVKLVKETLPMEQHDYANTTISMLDGMLTQAQSEVYEGAQIIMKRESGSLWVGKDRQSGAEFQIMEESGKASNVKTRDAATGELKKSYIVMKKVDGDWVEVSRGKTSVKAALKAANDSMTKDEKWIKNKDTGVYEYQDWTAEPVTPGKAQSRYIFKKGGVVDGKQAKNLRVGQAERGLPTSFAPQLSRKAAEKAAQARVDKAAKAEEVKRASKARTVTRKKSKAKAETSDVAYAGVKTGIDAVEHLKAGKSKLYAVIAQRVAPLVKSTKIQLVKTGDKLPTKVARMMSASKAVYSEKLNTIYIWERKNDEVANDETLAHELLHAALAQKIHAASTGKSADTRLNKAVDELYNIQKEVASYLNSKQERTEFENKLLTQMISQDVHEIMAWGMTDGDYQAFLDTIPYEKGTLWSHLVDQIKKILGLGHVNGTALEALLTTTDQIIEASIEEGNVPSDTQATTQNAWDVQTGDDIHAMLIGADYANLTNDQKNDLSSALGLDGIIPWQQILEQTGWFRGKDAKWRTLVPDREMSVNPKVYDGKKTRDRIKQNFETYTEAVETVRKNEAVRVGMIEKGLEPVMAERTSEEAKLVRDEAEKHKSINTTLGELIDHPALFKAYPDLKGVKVELDWKPVVAGDATAQYRRIDDAIYVNLAHKEFGMFKTKLPTVLLHEMTHAIQGREGFASGAGLALAEEINQKRSVDTAVSGIMDGVGSLIESAGLPARTVQALKDAFMGIRNEMSISAKLAEVMDEFMEESVLGHVDITAEAVTNVRQSNQYGEWIRFIEAMKGGRDLSGKTSYETYRSFLGEIEAHLVEASAFVEKLTPEMVEKLTEENKESIILNAGQREVAEDPAFIGGELAEQANLAAHGEAINMMLSGKTPKEIWDKTGWYYSELDSMWRFEIDDAEVSIKGESAMFDDLDGKKNTDVFSLGTVLNAKELFKNYPGLSNMPIRYNPELGEGAKFRPPAFFTQDMVKFTDDSMIELGDIPVDTTEMDIIHEIQHAIQAFEDFSIGTSLAKAGSMEQYLQTLGEMEARDVANRYDLRQMGMDPSGKMPLELEKELMGIEDADVTPLMQEKYLEEGVDYGDFDLFAQATDPEVEEQWNRYYGEKGSAKTTLKDAAMGLFKKVGEGVAPVLESMTEGLRKIDERLMVMVRRMEREIDRKNMEYAEKSKPFLKKYTGMSKKDQTILDYGLRNPDAASQLAVDQLVKKYGMAQEIADVRKILSEIHDRMEEVGLNEFDAQKGYFPRKVEDITGLMQYLHKDPKFGPLKKEIADAKAKAIAAGKPWSEREEQAIITRVLNTGKYSATNTLRKPGSSKERTLHHVTMGMAQFYKGSLDSLMAHIYESNESIETRKLTGTSNRVSMISKQRRIIKLLDRMDSITPEVLRREAKQHINKYRNVNKMTDAEIQVALLEGFDDLSTKLDNREEQLDHAMSKKIHEILADLDEVEQVKAIDLIKARLGQKGMYGPMATFRNVSLISALGSPTSAITQIGDLAWSVYKNGPVNTINAIFGEKRLTSKDFGFQHALREFQTGGSAKWVDKTLKATRLQWMDMFGKEVSMNATLNKVKRQSFSDFNKKWGETFGDAAQTVYNDIQNDNMTEDVKFMAFSDLSDYQPVSLSEMPITYLRGGNYRIFYTLKSFNIKAINNIYRESVGQIKEGNVQQGMTNLFGLVSLMTLAGATADEIKDVVMGRESSFGDNVHENLMKIAFLNKYSMSSAGSKGYLSTFLKDTLTPPTGFIDEPLKDITNMFAEDGEVKGEFLKALPYGRLVYARTTEGGATARGDVERKRIYKEIRKSVSGGGYSAVRREINKYNRTATGDERITAKKIKNIKAKERTKIRESR